MTERFRFLDALTYGIRTLFWRPVRALAYIAALTALTYGYYTWAQSEAGQAFFTGYMDASLAMAAGDFASFGAAFGSLMTGSLIAGCVVIAGAYRVYVREQPALRLPVQLGFDELRTLGVYLMLVLIGTGIMIASMIPLVIVSLVIGAVAGATGSPNEVAGVLSALIGLVVIIPLTAFYFYVFGRLAVGFALTIRDRKFRLGGWKASKGAGMKMMLAHLVLYIILVIAQFALSPWLMQNVLGSLTDPAMTRDTARMAAMMANPYGDTLWLAVPVQMFLTFLLFGPTAAVANWDARKRAAAEAAPAAEPVVAPADGNGTGEASGHPDTASS